MTSSAPAICLVEVFFTFPTNRVPSTLASSTCTSEEGASLKSLSILGSSFAVISAAVSSLAGLAKGGSLRLFKLGEGRGGERGWISGLFPSDPGKREFEILVHNWEAFSSEPRRRKLLGKNG